MTHFEVLHQNQDLPLGFESYSLLLVPDDTWPLQVGAEGMFELASRFKAFGDALGSTHLASWPFHGIQNHSKMVDVEVCSLVFSFAGMRDDLQAFIAKRSSQLSTRKSLDGGYHFKRARQLCALYNLPFNKGPYIVFFEEKPHIPTAWSRHNPWKDPEDPEVPSQPKFAIQFGDHSYADAVTLLNSLEFELLRGGKRLTSLRLLEIRLVLTRICRRLGSGMKTSLEVVKLGKEFLG